MVEQKNINIVFSECVLEQIIFVLQLRKGIKLDIERQAARKAENFRRLQEQKELTKSYRRALQENSSTESQQCHNIKIPSMNTKIKSGQFVKWQF